MDKQANIQKAISLMKSKGMSAEQALKTVYPDWDAAQIKKAAMTIRTMDKTAAVMQVSSAMVELDKTASKAKKIGLGLGLAGAGVIGHQWATNPSTRPFGKSSIYNKKNRSILKLNPNSSELEKARKMYSAETGKSSSKMSFSDTAKYVKKVRSKEKKASVGVSLTGLKYASNAMYSSHIEKMAGKQKQANIGRLFGPSIAGWAGKGAAGGGLAGGAAEIARLLRMTTPQGRQGVAAAEAALQTAKGSGGGVKRVMPWQKADPSKGQIGFASSGARDAAFLKEFDKLQAAGGFSKNPMGYVKLFAPNVLRGAGAGAAAGGALGAGAGAIAQNLAKKRMMETAKKVAVPAALGLGGLAVLSS